MSVYEVELENGQVYQVETEGPQQKNLINDPAGTIGRSAGKFYGGVVDAVTHPLETAGAVGGLAVGTVEKFSPLINILKLAGIVPPRLPQEVYPEEFGRNIGDRYGSLDRVKDTVLTDPVGALADVSMVAGGVGGAASLAGEVSGVGKLAALGKLITQGANVIDPIAGPLQGVGRAAQAGLAGRKIAPMAGKVDQEVLNASKAIGVELPASAISNSKAVPAIEAIASKGVFTSGVEKLIEKAQERLTQVSDDLVKTSGFKDQSQAGQLIASGAERYKRLYIDIKNRLYKQAIVPVKGKNEVIINPEETRKFITPILADKKRAAEILGPVADIEFFKQMKEATLKPINGRKFLDAIRELGQRLNNFNDPVVTGNKGTLQKLAAIMDDEFKAGLAVQRPQLAASLDRANQFYIDGLSKINSAYGKRIFKLAEEGQFDKIATDIISPTSSIDDIPRIKEIIGKKNVPILQSAIMEDIFRKSVNESGEFTPRGLGLQIKRFGKDKLAAIFEPGQLDVINKLETISGSLGKYSKIAGGSQTAFIGRLMTELFTTAFNPALGAQMFTIDAATSALAGSKAGRKLMTTGIELTSKGRRINKTLSGVSKKSGAVSRFSNLASLSQGGS